MKPKMAYDPGSRGCD